MDKQYFRDYERRPEQRAKRAAYRRTHKKQIASKNRAYAKAQRICGTYRIRCLKTGICYYGASTQMRGRHRLHRSQLNRGIHHCAALQAAWLKYGENNFVIEIVQELPINEAAKLEKHLIETTPSFNAQRKGWRGWRNGTQNGHN